MQQSEYLNWFWPEMQAACLKQVFYFFLLGLQLKRAKWTSRYLTKYMDLLTP